MKTGMEAPLMGVVIIAVLVALWNAWSGMQVDLSVASLNATIAGQAAPEPVLIAGEWVVKALVGTLLGGVVSAGIWWAVRQARRWLRRSEANAKGRNWQPGPNANWGRTPRAPSEVELMRMALLQQMAGGARYGGGAPPTRPPGLVEKAGEDEPQITF